MAVTEATELHAASEYEAGKSAAERLGRDWPNVDWIPQDVGAEWARGAVERFAELIREQLPIFRASQRKSEQGARRISPDPFQGILECIQNADDLGAGELRIAVRGERARRELIIVHDGDGVRLHHVGAMVLPWLTTKEEDSEASGRFGIGQKTLRALGEPVELHGPPFHVRLDLDDPAVCEPLAPIEGFYSGGGGETALLIPLRRSIDVEALNEFVTGLGGRSLLFLRNVRRLSVWDCESRRPTVDHKLREVDRAQLSSTVSSRRVEVERVVLRDPRTRKEYARYECQVLLTRGDKRDQKASTTTTRLGVAIPLGHEERGRVFDTVTMPIETGFPASINAQLEPAAGRTTLVKGDPWNEHRLSELGELLGAAAVDSLSRDGGRGWTGVPLHAEQQESEEWLDDQLRAIVTTAQQRLVTDFRIVARDGVPRSLSESIYEHWLVDGLLDDEDFAQLNPRRAPVSISLRDRLNRWRKVLDEIQRCDIVSVSRALDLLDDLDRSRDPAWFVQLAAAASRADSFDEFLSKPGTLLADGTRVAAPGKDDPRTLVESVAESDFGVVVGVALPIHPAYLQ